MPGPGGERCIDCVKFDPSKRVCRAKAPLPQIAPVGTEYTLVLPAVMQDDLQVDKLTEWFRDPLNDMLKG